MKSENTFLLIMLLGAITLTFPFFIVFAGATASNTDIYLMFAGLAVSVIGCIGHKMTSGKKR